MIQAPEAFLSMSLMKNELYNKSYKTCAHVPTELNKNEAKKMASFVIPLAIFLLSWLQQLFCQQCTTANEIIS